MRFFDRLARYLAQPHIADWLWCRAYHTPFDRLDSPDGCTVQAWRYWLFNPKHLPFCIRLHQICQPDGPGQLPAEIWDCRVFVLQGWYVDETADGTRTQYRAGDTVVFPRGTAHRIALLPPSGCPLLVVTYR